MPSGDAGMSLSISGTGQLLLGTAYCPNRLASGQDWGKLRYSQTLWEGGWASQQLNHLCGPLWGLHCPRRPSQQQGWWQHTPSALLCALQRRDQLGSHCFPSGEVSSVQRKPHWALRPTLNLMNKAENMAYQNELYITKCTSVLYPHPHSSFPQTSPSPHFRLSFDTSPTLPHQQPNTVL